ncbi:MAG: RnfABCDGE type electron transport complex subunit B [Planctomycetes bacterium]|nr:RnfABCDGE type electron transport complex subunit B [Planctomycetota bacterium]
MGDVLMAGAIMAGLGVLLGAMLAFAYRFLRVPEDPRTARVEQLLPGTNCGGCGEPGCRAFAEALTAGARQPSGCTVAGPEAVAAIAAFLGVDAGALDRKVARLHCAGGKAQAVQIAAYDGFESCRGAHVTGGGGKGCSWGCLGLADCQRVCDFGAITMNDNGLPVVDVDKCTACGDCVVACPRDLFELLPLRQPLLVQCRVPLAGEAARQLCTAACDACGRCVQDAPEGLLRMVDNLPVVDYASAVDAGPAPTFRCPTGAIQFVAKAQFAKQEVRA